MKRKLCPILAVLTMLSAVSCGNVESSSKTESLPSSSESAETVTSSEPASETEPVTTTTVTVSEESSLPMEESEAADISSDIDESSKEESSSQPEDSSSSKPAETGSRRPESSSSKSPTTTTVTSRADSSKTITTSRSGGDTSSSSNKQDDTSSDTQPVWTPVTSLPPADGKFDAAVSAQAFVDGMGVGWNLGNTLDPVNCTWVSNDLDYETAWGNPKATKALIDYIRSEGFRTVRVPVSWADHTSGAPDYTVKAKWMDRVQQVVDWCMEDGLYVILNVHHEDSWLTKASSDYEGVMQKYTAIWEQIADRFKGYDEHLILESMNEIGFDDLGTKNGCELMNRINAEFVSLVRGSGGFNSERYLLLAGYWTDVDRSIEGGIKMPDDNRTILSVHYYSPSTFAIADKTSTWGFRESWGTASDIKYLEGQMKKLKTNYIDKGVPVIIGEFGATHTDKVQSSVNLFVESVIEYALKYKMCPIWWDGGTEIDRTALTYKYSGLQAAVHLGMSSAG